MTDGKFTEQDKQMFIDFLNFIAVKAIFPDWKTEDTVKHFKFLSHMQNQILPKIDANILEIIQMKQLDESKKEEKHIENKPEKAPRAKVGG